MDSVAAVNREVVALWKSHFGTGHLQLHWPLICPEPIKDGLAVVGCNPALPKAKYYSVPIFRPDSRETEIIDQLAKLEAEARKTYSYYFPFQKLAAQVRLPWEHVDLFFYRETSQLKLRSLVLKADGTLNDFGKCQIALAVRLLTLAQPRLILVANALAARIFKRYFGMTTLDTNGLYWAALGSCKAPVFFSSMLSGVRPLDNHSLERLVWHIQKTLNTSYSGVAPCQ